MQEKQIQKLLKDISRIADALEVLAGKNYVDTAGMITAIKDRNFGIDGLEFVHE